MSTEIKLRAWDNVNNNMELNIQHLDSLNEYLHKEKYNAMLFSGLKDNNGVDIYSGDVVYIAGYGNYIVEFPFFELYDRVFSGDSSDIESIIGNIYQNPELL